ncbi:MAG: SpaA isopeptide-forming pilin-related protein, partial [Phoenicibacter congonensis]|nr:SpaA isopeptide-forming pilin-related protein [Phoenicibacter congonensis]
MNEDVRNLNNNQSGDATGDSAKWDVSRSEMIDRQLKEQVLGIRSLRKTERGKNSVPSGSNASSLESDSQKSISNICDSSKSKSSHDNQNADQIKAGGSVSTSKQKHNMLGTSQSKWTPGSAPKKTCKSSSASASGSGSSKNQSSASAKVAQARAKSRDAVANAPLWQKSVCCLLAFVLCFQMFFTNGVTTAIAESTAQDSQISAVQSDKNTGESVAQEENSAPSTGENSSSSVISDTSENGSTVISDTSENGGNNEAAESNSSEVISDTSEKEGKNEAVAKDWTDVKDNLTLKTDGLDFEESLAKQAEKIASQLISDTSENGAAVISDTSAATGTSSAASAATGTQASSIDEVVLPSTLNASLNIRATLNAAAGQGRDGDDTHKTIVDGDNFTITLPGKITADFSSLKLKNEDGKVKASVYAVNKETNKASETVIGTAEISENSIKIVLNEQAAGAESVDAIIDLDVLVSSELVQAQESTIDWTMQKDTEAAKLTIPSKETIANALGLLVAENGDGDAANIATLSDDTEVSSHVGDKKKVQSGTTKAQDFTTHWADNNNSGRPSIDSMVANQEYRLYYSLDGGVTKKTLTTDGVTLTDEAKADLGISSLTPVSGSLVKVEKTKTNEFTISSAVSLPQTIITKELKRIDEDEETGEKTEVWEDIDTQTVSYYIRHDYAGTTEIQYDDQGSPVNSQFVYDGSYLIDTKATLKSEDRGQKYVVPFKEETISLLSEESINVKYNFGDGISDDWTFLDFFFENPDAQFLNVQIGNETFTITGDQLEALYEGGYVTGRWTDDGDHHKTAILTIRHPQYYPDGTPITYSYQQQSVNQDTDSEYNDEWQIIYDNTQGTNHGSDASAVYNGGTITFTHYGTTKYSATKKWLDDDASARPATTYSLWRFVDNGTGDYGAASQVKAGDSSGFIEFTISAEDNQKAGSNDINLGDYLDKQLKATNTMLAKYDQDGYPYVYMLREDAPSGYERLFGTTVNTDPTSPDYGKIVKGTDTKPNYYKTKTSDGTETAGIAKDPRPSGDLSVYNNGTLINRHKSSTSVQATKTWVIGSFQDQLNNVSAVFKLQRISKENAKQNEDGSWSPKEGFSWADVNDQTVELTDWNAETLTKTLSASAAKYDAEGKEFVYRWVETDVKQDGQSTVISSDDGVTSFYLYVNDADGSKQQLLFDVDSSYNAQTGALTIVNKYRNETEANVHKYWATTEVVDGQTVIKTDDAGNTIWNQDEKPNGQSQSVTVTLVQTGSEGRVAFGPFTLDGTPDTQATEIQGLDGATYQEKTSWNMIFENLPMYDENGSKYTYMAFEGNVAGYMSQRTYTVSKDGELNVTDIYNTPGPGDEWSDIRVAKSWTDGGNTSSRTPVKVGIYAGRDMDNAKYREWVDGGKQGDMPAGAVHYDKGDLIATTTLTEAEGWYWEGGVAISGVVQENGDVYIRELSNDATGENKATVITKEDAEKDAAGTYFEMLRNWSDNSKNEYNERMFTGETDVNEAFCYQVNYGYDETLKALEVDNQRLGQVWIQLSKEWNDEGHVDKRPDCRFKITCNDDSITFFDKDGVIYAKVSDNIEFKICKNYKEGEEVEALTTSEATITDDGHALLRNIDTSDNAEVMYVGALPKYNASGFVIDYTVSEEITTQGTEYSGGRTYFSENYDSPWHFTDNLIYEYTNSRTGTKDVAFNTRWYDTYVEEDLNQRPDVYVTLYKSVYQYDSQGDLIYNDDGTPACTYEVVTGHENHRWSTLVDGGLSGKYNERAVIKNLPKYDSRGKEIVYYATVKSNTSSDAFTNLHYQDQWYTTTMIDKTGKEAGNQIWDDHNAADPEITKSTDEAKVSDSITALREDGTFNFEIAALIQVQGYKIWKNVPGIYETDDLPKISIYLQRRVANSDTAWQMPHFSAADNEQGYTIDDMVGAEGSDVADGKTVVAATHNLNFVSINKYIYSMKYYGVNTTNDSGDISGEIADALELPRYDANGRLYEYRTFEVIDGLLSTASNPVPGGFTIDQLNNMTGETVGNPDIVFVTNQGEGSAFSITNAFDPQYGKLSVKKIYEGFQQGDKLADVTFTLYRYYVHSDGKKSEAEKVDTKTITADQFDSEGVGQTTFENVDIYAPNGQYWVYYTTETNIDGYETYSMLGNATGADDSNFKAAEADTTNGGWLSPDSYKTDGSGKNYNPTWTPVADDDVPDFSFKNNYTPGNIKLNGTKVWRDSDNLANTRPENITITLKRTYKNGDADQSLDGGKVPLQETDENAANYLKWTKSAKGDWTYTISNLEKWATDGNAWVYSVTEEKSSLDGTEYVITKNGGSVTAADGAKLPDIINELKTIVTPKKTWEEDNEDWLAQRPTFYYQLQARVETSSDNWGDWAEVVSAFYTSGKFDVDWNTEYPSTSINMGSAGKLYGHVMKTSYGTLDSIGVIAPDGRGKNWTGSSWDNLPLSVSYNGTVYKIQYRVVEKAMQYTSEGQNTVIKFDDPDADGNYTETYHPYQPSISTVETTDQVGRLTFNCVMKNTLDKTQLEITKSWKDDDNNSWATRPGTKKATDAWTLQFALQRTTDSESGTWEWVTTRGVKVDDADALNSDGTFNESLRVVELSSNSADFTKAFDNLPKTDTDGNTYTYRAVERLTGSYALVNISGDVIASALDGRVKLVTVAATLDKETFVSSVSFENVLNTVGLQGTKTWNAYGNNNLIPNFDTQKPTMELQKSTDGKNWTKASRADGTQPTITWEKVSDTVWKYSYTGLPQSDNNGVTLKYRAVEKMDAKNGYVDSYDGKGYYDSDNKVYVNDGITNTATRFTFKKLGDTTTGSSSEELNGVTLKVRDSSNKKTYAVWMQDDGVMKSYVNYDGVTEAATAEPDLTKFTEIKDTDDQVNAGWILALPAGTYKVTESRVPDGHVKASDFTLTINKEGVVSANGTSGKEVSINVVDPVLRGNVELYKFYKHGNDNVEMPGMTFDLYKGTADGDNVKIAEGVTLQEFQKDSSGKRYGWITGASATDKMVLTYLKGDDGVSLLGKYYETTKDGLPEGDYFFKETGASPYTVEADTTYAFTISKNSDTTKQPANVYCSAENTEFNATASLAKVNSETGEAVSDAKFKLEYKAAGTDTYVTLGSAFATGKNYAAKANMAGFNEAAGTAGALKFTSLKKGDYRLTEVSNTGYEVPTGDDAVVATWTIAEADQNKDFDLLTDEAVTWTNAVFKDGSLSNTPLHGAIQMKKVSSASASTTLNGAEFGLYVKAGNDWVAVTGGESLFTGKAYSATVGEAGNVTAIAEDSSADAPAGTITVTNLPWGTYRFEEVAPADGYVIGTADGKCISGEIAINRDNVAGSATTPISTNNVQNTPSSLKLYKTNSAGTTNLGGAKFTVEGDFVSGHSVKTLLTEANTGEAKPMSADDTLEAQMIVGNTYTITETLSPKGYTLIAETATIQVKLNADGTYTTVGDAPEGWSVKTDGGVSRLYRSDDMTTASLAKRGENGEPLQGSEFVVQGEMADGSTSLTLTPSGENAIDTAEGKLIVGKTYQVQETKVPLGYAKLPDVTIKALDNGKIEFVDDDHDGWTIEGDYELVAKDKIASFKLAKVSESGQSLVNATFNVEGEFVVNQEAGTAGKSTIEYTVTSASAQDAGITGLLVEGTTYVDAQGNPQTATGDYVISEKSAPSGYISTDMKFAIHVNADGSVEVKDGQGSDLPYTFDAATKTVTLSNPPIELTFKKAGIDKTALTGALFTIKGKFAVGDGQLTEEKTIDVASI